MTNADRLAVSAQSLALAHELLARLHLNDRVDRPVIGIAGESGSGKSVAATSLAMAFADMGRRARVLHQDDYFIRPPRTNHDYRMVDVAARTGPQEVRLDLLAEHIATFRAGGRIEAPVVNYPANRFDHEVIDLADARVLIVEGTYVLRLDQLDARIFFTATHEDTAARRRARNRDLDDPRIRQVLELEHRLIAPQAAVADLLVDRDFAIVAP